MALALEGTGLELRCVENGREALEVCREGDFDLVMVDLQLPDFSGIELSQKLHEQAPDIPVILVTAQASMKNEEIPEWAGIVEVILKPYTRDLVLEALAKHLGADFAKALLTIHPEDPVKAARLSQAMAKEFRQAALKVREAGPAEVVELVSKIRHRLTASLALFPMRRVEKALKAIREAGGANRVLLAELASALEDAAAAVETNFQ